MKIWGYWATLGWAVLAFLAGQFIGFGLLVWLRAGVWNSILETPFDGVLVTLFIVVSNPITIGVLMLAVRFARADQAEYLALKSIVESGEIGEVAQITGQKSYQLGARPEWQKERASYGSTVLWIGMLLRISVGRPSEVKPWTGFMVMP